MVEQKPSKLTTRVRFPSPAPNTIWNCLFHGKIGLFSVILACVGIVQNKLGIRLILAGCKSGTGPLIDNVTPTFSI